MEAKVRRLQRMFWSPQTSSPGINSRLQSSHSLRRPRPQKENNAPAPKKTENEAERMEMSAVGDEMEVELSADTLDYVIFNSRLLRLAMWSTLTPRMLATPSWSVLVFAYIFFHPRWLHSDVDRQNFLMVLIPRWQTMSTRYTATCASWRTSRISGQITWQDKRYGTEFII